MPDYPTLQPGQKLTPEAEADPDAALRAKLAGRDPVAELEAWKHSRKSHSCKITTDNGYGASCWEVVLYNGPHVAVRAYECAFTYYPDHAPDPRSVFLMKQDGPAAAAWGGEWEEWPGLGPTILAALDHWHARCAAKEPPCPSNSLPASSPATA